MPRGTAQGPVAASGGVAPQRRRGIGPALSRPGTLAIIMTVFAIILVACGGGTDSRVTKLPSISSGSSVEMDEDLAPNFIFTLFQGEDKLGSGDLHLRLPVLRDKPIVLNFWAGLCPPCRAELPDLQEFYDEFNDRVTLVGIDLGQFTGLGSLQDAKDLLEELNITYPAGSTSEASVVQNYKIFGMPTTIFIDSTGRIFKNWGGALNSEILRDFSLQMLAQ